MSLNALFDAIDLAQRLGTEQDFRHRDEPVYPSLLLDDNALWHRQFREIQEILKLPDRVLWQSYPAATSVALTQYGYEGAIAHLPAVTNQDLQNAFVDNRVHAIHGFGHRLLYAALHCLPQDILELTELWSVSSTEFRQLLLEELAAVFQAWFFTLGFDTCKDKIWQDRINKIWPSMHHGERQYFAHQVLPRLFGQADVSLVQPNCLGVSLMLAAWCELAGARYVYCNTLLDSGSGFRHISRDIFELVLREYPATGLEIPFGRQLEIKRDLAGLNSPTNSASNFHHFVMVELEPDVWMTVDPYQHVVQLCQSNANQVVSSTASLVEELQYVVPGVTLPVWLESYQNQHQTAEQAVRQAIRGTTQAQQELGGWAEQVMPDLNDREQVAFEAVEKQILGILQAGKDRATGPGHFSVEIGVPKYQAACMVLNHLAAWDDEFACHINPGELASLTGSQLVWHDCLIRMYRESGTVQSLFFGIIDLLKEIPPGLLHERNTELLKYIDPRREKDNADSTAESCRDTSAA